VGTESRLKLVIDTLADLVVGSSDDPESRLTHLRSEQRRIEDEIDRIEADGRVTKYQPAQIRERFGTAVSLLRQLQGDFRAVEDSFRDITLQVQQRQAQGRDTRGGILEFALDAEDVLKGEDQGVSFYEFVKLILSPSQTERLERIIQEVRRIPELMTHQDGLETVRGMVTLLHSEADKVMRTNQRLSATLRRLLDSRAHSERLQIARLLSEIRSHAVALRTATIHKKDSPWSTRFRRFKGNVEDRGVGPIASSATAVTMPLRSEAGCARVAFFRCWPCAAPRTGAAWDAGVGWWNARSPG
jgi:hypothetical protein